MVTLVSKQLERGDSTAGRYKMMSQCSTIPHTQQRQRMMFLSTTLVIAIFTIAVSLYSQVVVIDAFTAPLIPVGKSAAVTNSKILPSSFFVPTVIPKTIVRLGSANTDEGTTEQQAETTAVSAEDADNVEVTESSESDDTVTVITAGDAENSTGEADLPIVDQEDPEITAMKAEIQTLERDIKNTRRQLADINDRVDDYTKTGYARKVAEMENMRRARSMLQSSNKYTATATIIAEFLPAMDSLYALKSQYETNEFGKMYNALPDAIRSGYTSMGCTEYSIEPNTAFDANRMTSIYTEPSSAIAKDCVIRTELPGMELQGNTIRLAKVVISSSDTTGSAAQSTDATTETTE